MSDGPNWTTFWVRPPRAGAPRSESLTFVRSMILRSQIIGVPMMALLALDNGAWFRWLALAVVASTFLDVAYLTWKIARLRAKGG